MVRGTPKLSRDCLLGLGVPLVVSRESHLRSVVRFVRLGAGRDSCVRHSTLGF